MTEQKRIILVEKNHQRASGRTRKLINKFGPLYELEEIERTSGQKVVTRIKVRPLNSNWCGWLNAHEIIYKDYEGPLTREDFKSDQ